MTVHVLVGDCRTVMADMDAEFVDAIVTDPPYGLSFMGKDWDHGVPGVPFWTEALRVLKPGGHLLAFGGTRTYHRLAVAIEDAGFEIRDCLSWLYGQGFPKSLDVSKAIDKMAGSEREVVGRSTNGAGNNGGGLTASDRRTDAGKGMFGEGHGEFDVTAPATPEAAQWAGWGTALKPAWEPVIVARKPFIGTVAANVLAHGTGALNIDACRIGVEASDPNWRAPSPGVTAKVGERGIYGAYSEPYRSEQNLSPEGRWPANVILDEDAAALLDEQAGERKSNNGRGVWATGKQGYDGGFGACESPAYGDTGGPSRFYYVAKASRRERNAGLDGMPERAANEYGLTGHADTRPGRVQQDRQNASQSNVHPCVKPIALMRWLVRLVTPPGGLVLDPFMGSGSTGCAAVLEGFRFVGIDQDAEYATIAERRIAYWSGVAAEPAQLRMEFGE